MVRTRGGAACEVTSPEGIGRFTLVNTADRWPAPLVLRLRLKGLESLVLAAGSRRLEVSLASSPPHCLLVQYSADHADDSRDSRRAGQTETASGTSGDAKPGDAKPESTEARAPRELSADSELCPHVTAMDRRGREVGRRLPPQGGWIEVTVPPRLLEDAKSLHVRWIDFYRG